MLKEFRAWMSQMKANGERLAMDKTGTTDLTTIATGLIILGVVGAVGIYIMNEVYQIAVITSGSQFYTASTKIIDIINTGFGLLVIAVLALNDRLSFKHLKTNVTSMKFILTDCMLFKLLDLLCVHSRCDNCIFDGSFRW